MIAFVEAYNIILSQKVSTNTERIELPFALNRVLAEDAISDTDMPPFNKSAMDGFACRKADLNNELQIIETIAAGTIPTKQTGPNECSRIMTGAMIPDGADFVIMKEHIQELGNGKIIRIRENFNVNICYKGEDVKTGDVIIQKGALLLPQHVAALSSAGIFSPLVFTKPSIAILSTGNELVEPNMKPGISQIRNSNGYQMFAQVSQMGLKPDYFGIVQDNESLLYEKLATALNQNQVILISGGVSVGDYDFVPKVLNQLGVNIIFHGIKAKPGKHLLFGRKNNCFVFGMPGNPVSSFIQFEILVKPLLYKIMGHSYKPFKLKIPIANPYKRKKSEVLEFIPVSISPDGEAITLEYHGSAHISSYIHANGIMEIPLGINEISRGEIVYVRPI
jgi:molybdopterin molybdotransferase